MPDPTCVVCRAPLPPREPGKPGRQRQYCSKSCTNRADYLRRVASGWKKTTPSVTEYFDKVCAWCDKAYVTSRRRGQYCSNSCARCGTGRANLTSELNWRWCKHCERHYCRGVTCPLQTTHPRKPPPDMSPRPCDSCGTPFTPTSPSGWFASYCSDACRNREAKARRRSRTRRDQWRTDRNQGRIRRYAIYQRDNWRCQLCGKKVDPSLPHQDAMAPTLDHVLPVSLGGEHVEANLQLAHRACNSAKKDGVNGNGEQLRLAV